jgi:hypothetical protein
LEVKVYLIFLKETQNIPGGFNGGGEGFCGNAVNPSGSGGGSTDIRLGGQDISQWIIVVGGGGSAGAYDDKNLECCFGGHGGGLEGLDGGGLTSSTDQ